MSITMVLHPQVQAVLTPDDIPASLRNTPFEKLLRFHNMNEDFDHEYQSAELLVVKCMDYRKHLRLPERFAYIVRNAGGNARSNEFSMAFAIGVGGISHVALISHTDCGMVGLDSKKDIFIQGMMERAGWSAAHAEMFFHMKATEFGFYDPVTFIALEARRFQAAYPKITFQPFLYNIEDDKLYLINDA